MPPTQPWKPVDRDQEQARPADPPPRVWWSAAGGAGTAAVTAVLLIALVGGLGCLPDAGLYAAGGLVLGLIVVGVARARDLHGPDMPLFDPDRADDYFGFMVKAFGFGA